MFTQTNRIVRTIRNTKLTLAAAVAAVGLGTATHAYGAVSDVTSITTHLTVGSPTVVDDVTGAGTDSGYTSSKTYNVDYAGDDLAITSITSGANTYAAGPIAGSVVLNRSTTDADTDIVYEQGTVSPTATTLSLMGPQESGAKAALSGNNLLVGADNVLNNAGNPNGNNSDIQRIDVIFPAGITPSASAVFAIFDRGVSTAHDGFEIAAITSLSGGVPTNYGPLLTETTGSWGKTNVEPAETYSVTRQTGGTGPFHPADQTDQAIGGVVIPTLSLASSTTTIYGYSLFATDTSVSGSALASVANFPTTTTEANGGLDLVGTEAVLYTSTAVPEPTTAVVGLFGIAGLLGRRSKRRLA
jgi:hypothetical protein